ncbi:MAG: nicotinate-nucleotide adenylyltransferase, partial [Gemmatimonadota bacterium]
MSVPGEGVSLRKGLMGGTFNPPHVAHLIVAHIVREELALEQVVLVPTHSHAFKGEAEASPRDRAAMTELAVAGDPGLAADRLEIERGGVSYTVDTLRKLRSREPETVWHLILGEDNLSELQEWQEVEALPGLAEIVVVTRRIDGAGEGLLDTPFPRRLRWVPVPTLEISSTTIRRRIAEGRTIRHWVPPAVEAYIAERGLYVER